MVSDKTNVSGVKFTATAPVGLASKPAAAETGSPINVEDVHSGAVAADIPTRTIPVAEAPVKTKLGAKIGVSAAMVAAAVGGMGLLGGAAPAQASTVYSQCTYDAWQVQDMGQLNHMATLYASPTTGYNRASGLYDASADMFGITHSASELTRLDGNQALKQLSCNQPVRFYSPQTGWLKFHNLNDFHGYEANYNQNGVMPWDQSGVYLNPHYEAPYGSPYYDSDFYQYNDYNSYVNGFYAGMGAGAWSYSQAPSAYTPPPQWYSSAPQDPFANNTYSPGYNGNGSAPADPYSNGGGYVAPSAPVDPFNNNGGYVAPAPAPSQSAPVDPFNNSGTTYQAPTYQAPTYQAPTQAAPVDPFNSGAGQTYAPSGSPTYAPSPGGAPADPFNQ
jgi:hypothetical protein